MHSDAEQQLLLLSLPPPTTALGGRTAEGSGGTSSTPEPASLGLGPSVGAFEVLLARLHERQQQHKANHAAAADGAEHAGVSSMPTLMAAIATPQECLVGRYCAWVEAQAGYELDFGPAPATATGSEGRTAGLRCVLSTALLSCL